MNASPDSSNEANSRIDGRLFRQFWQIAKPYWFSEQRWKARGLLALLLIMSVVVNGLNVGISFVFRFVDTSLAEKQADTFWRYIFIYIGILILGTPIVVLYGFLRDKLGRFWREWLTKDFLDRYFRNRAYYEINQNTDLDNPDQRISEDINSFTVTSLQFLLVVLGAIITLFSFTGVLISISLPLTATLLVYAIGGTIITTFIGKRLIAINFNQLRREADFRYGLVHVRDNAEAIAFYQGEDRESLSVKDRFMQAIRNYDLLIGWQRNLDFFTTGYGYLVAALPYLVVAPIYLSGQTDFGTITQAAIAFRQIFGALSIIVTQFEKLTAFAAGIKRLGAFREALDQTDMPAQHSTIDTVNADVLSLHHVTLQTPNRMSTLVSDLSVELQPGDGLLIVGHSGCGKSSVLRAIAGLWNCGTGKITRPNLEEMLFLPQRPYMVLGTLREQLLYPNVHQSVDENQLRQVLQQVNLADLPERVGGFEAELDWANVLSLGEQQRLAIARLLMTKPRYAILDEATSALDWKNEALIYKIIQASQTTYISVGHRSSLLKYHRHVLKLEHDSRWKVLPAQEYALETEVLA
ncbi:ABC transporter ATP-binding protein/permease [Oscillatoria sp. FACHB-1407]|uniref:ABC transporter ATP-binding protein/permease n=1 Tax=Oscillatoria sp. FACHB-1407 TaxID=2692847 RepID=UPI00168466E7|nr:ABC transporter ATP-binding protein/permease [Oscillatoria sp. FACHB-1407]MBD2463799.1 ABC transporter ATP-binding protein/permease [Oscillatoria sp. FACHB-1407]